MAKKTNKKANDEINIGDLDIDDVDTSKQINVKDLIKKASSGFSLAAQMLRFINMFSKGKK